MLPVEISTGNKKFWEPWPSAFLCWPKHVCSIFIRGDILPRTSSGHLISRRQCAQGAMFSCFMPPLRAFQRLVARISTTETRCCSSSCVFTSLICTKTSLDSTNDLLYQYQKNRKQKNQGTKCEKIRHFTIPTWSFYVIKNKEKKLKKWNANISWFKEKQKTGEKSCIVCKF